MAARRASRLLLAGHTERELSAEIQSHLDLHIDDNIRAGMTPDEARRAALVKFGPVEAIKDEYRDRRSLPILEILVQDLRYAARRLARQPGFAGLVILTLALGVGANATMFGFVDALLFRLPDQVREPDRLVAVNRAGNYVRYQRVRRWRRPARRSPRHHVRGVSLERISQTATRTEPSPRCATVPKASRRPSTGLSAW